MPSCIDELEKSLGAKLTDQEKKYLGRKLDEAIKRVRATDPGNLHKRLQEILDEGTDEEIAQALIEKRNAALNLKAELMQKGFVDSWGDNPGLALESALVGTQYGKLGARDSVGLTQDQRVGVYLQSHLNRLLDADLLDIARSGVYDKEVIVARHLMDQPSTNKIALAKLPKEAVQYAKILEESRKVPLHEANKAGAWIKPLPGYTFRRVHNMEKIRKRKDAWLAFMKEHVDWDTDMPGATDREIHERLSREQSQLATGEFVDFDPNKTPGMKGFGNVARKLSKERVYNFKTPEAEYQYLIEFGNGTIHDNVESSFSSLARATALMEKFGPNAEATLANVIDAKMRELHKQGANPKIIDEFATAARDVWIRHWPAITGEANIPAHALAANIGQTYRNVEMFSKLGSAVFSATGDAVSFGLVSAKHGQSFFKGMAEHLAAEFSAYGAHGKAMAAEAGVTLNHMAQSGFRLQAETGVTGYAAKFAQFTFKWGSMNWWTDHGRVAKVKGLASRFAEVAGQSFDELYPGIRTALEQHNLTAKEWDVIRQGSRIEADGGSYLSPDGVRYAVPETAIANYLKAQGKNPTKHRIAAARHELATKFGAYFFDMATTAVVETDVKSRGLVSQLGRPGTIGREIGAGVFQFMGFPITYTRRVLGGIVLGGASDIPKNMWVAVGRAVMNAHGERDALLKLIVGMTLMGAVGTMLTDLAKGRKTTVPESPEEFAAFLARAMLKSGGMGMYGDLLFKDLRKGFGRGFVEQMTGPLLGEINSLADIGYGLLRGEGAESAAKGMEMLYRTAVPNLWYTRAATDYLLLYNFQEVFDPGHLARSEARLEKLGVEYILPPSEVLSR